jgi:hypothetical protein
MDEGKCIDKMEIFMMGNGRIIKLLVRVFISKLMDDNTMVSGKKINNTDLVLKHKKMALHLKDILIWGFEKVKLNSN